MTELLTRKDAAAYLATKGIRSSQSTLARYAMGWGWAAICADWQNSLL